MLRILFTFEGLRCAMVKSNVVRQPELVPPAAPASAANDDPDFSLVTGGPLYQLYIRAHMMRPALDFVGRRVLAVMILCWLPLLILASVRENLAGGVQVAFLYDPDPHIRLLLSLPLMIGAEVVVHQRMRLIVGQFLRRNMIAPEDRPRFEELIASAMRLRNSVLFEVLLLAFVVTVGHWIWSRNVSLSVSTWYAIREGAQTKLTLAGYWYAFVSLTFFRFVMYRWYFRLFIWYRFLWQVRRLPLRLNLYHPDNVAGLGFLTASLPAFAPVFVAQTIAVAGVIYDRILYAGKSLPQFKVEIVCSIVLFTLLLLLPLTFFAIRLEYTSRVAKAEFGVLASHYVDDFRRKWVLDNAIMADNAGKKETLLGTSDLQSLSDLDNSFDVVSQSRLFPITRQSVIRLAIALAAPFLPLMLTMFPLDEILRRLFRMLF
jgi:hypothetical protein